jgi:hypothetical protein
LSHVLGFFTPTEHAVHEAIDPIAVELDELVERTLVTSDEAFYESPFGRIFET